MATNSELFRIDISQEQYKTYLSRRPGAIFDPLPLLSLFPDKVFSYPLTPEMKISLLLHKHCDLTVNYSLQLQNEKGTLRYDKHAGYVEGSGDVMIHNCKFHKAGLDNYMRIPLEHIPRRYRTDDLIDQTIPLPDEYYNLIPDIIAGHDLADHHKEQLLTSERTNLSDTLSVIMDRTTGLLYKVNLITGDDFAEEQYILLHAEECQQGKQFIRMHMWQLSPTNPAYEYLFAKQYLGVTDYGKPYDPNYWIDALPDKVLEHSLSNTDKVLLITDGYLPLGRLHALELNTRQRILYYVKPSDQFENTFCKEVVVRKDCEYDPELRAQLHEQLYRLPVEEHFAALQAIRSHNNLPTASKRVAGEIDKMLPLLPKTINGIPIDEQAGRNLLVTGQPVQVGINRILLDFNSGLLRQMESPKPGDFILLKQCTFGKDLKQQTETRQDKQPEYRKERPKDKGLEI